MKSQQETQNTKRQQAQMAPSSEVAEALQLVLADTFVLYMKTYAVHWNYQGPKFFSVHKMTEEHYAHLASAIDEIAERLRALGKGAPISLETILANSDLGELRKKNAATDDKALMDLASDHLLLSRRAHEAALVCGEADDLFSQDMMIQRVGEHDKAAWMIRSFMQRGELSSESTATLS